MQEYIILEGCKENNLKDVSLQIPKRKITVFTGVSGSGKSSIVFDTVAKEAQRQLNETFSAFVRTFLPKVSSVKADGIYNLSTPIIIDQSRLGGNPRSTLATVTDIHPYLRTLYSRLGKPYLGKANVFSFNDPEGMCPHCQGLGKSVVPNLDEIINEELSLEEGAILLPGFSVDSWQYKLYSQSGFFDVSKKIKDYSEEERHMFYHQEPMKIKVAEFGNMSITYEGLLLKFEKGFLSKDKELSDKAQAKLAKYSKEAVCSHCEGRRYDSKVYDVKIQGYDISELCRLQLDELVPILEGIKEEEVQPIIHGLLNKVQNIIDIGLGYLTLDRETSTLSGGESQRIKMVKYLNSNLIDLLYIFDEPSVGLHPRDVHKLNQLLMKLRDKGNTVLVVEHDPDVIKIADHIVDVGPKAGKDGGHIVFEGSVQELLESNTLTGSALRKVRPMKEQSRNFSEMYKVENCSTNNLKNITVEIPKNVFTVVSGVAGSGKSSLLKYEFMKKYPETILIDQSPVSTNSRSSLATYSGIMDAIRKLFAKQNGIDAGYFSSNSKGACEHCNGTGVVTTNLAFMDNIKITCSECEGTKFKKEVLEYTYKDKNIFEVLDLSVKEALEFFELKAIKTKIKAMDDMGIGYLSLGQTLDTLSGGECQRLKLASELLSSSTIYILDEPTTGLHMSDIERFHEIIEHLVDKGMTVIVIEHNVEMMKQADYIIDIGPDGGSKGGEIVYAGPLAGLLECKESLTAKYIHHYEK